MNAVPPSMCPFEVPLRALAAALLLCSVGPALARAQTPSRPAVSHESSKGFRDALSSAVRLYRRLEYERALKGLDAAEAVARQDTERAEVALYRGLILGELARRKESMAQFKTALTLHPELKLPSGVAPKIERDFEAVRKSLATAQPSRGARPGSKPSPAARTSPPADAPQVSHVPEPTQVTPPQLLPALPTVTQVEAPPRRLPVLPLTLAGASVVAGGLGGYFGIRSRSHVDAAMGTDIQSVRGRHHSDARRQATAANVLFGVALTSAAGAVVTWLLSDAEAPAPAAPR